MENGIPCLHGLECPHRGTSDKGEPLCMEPYRIEDAPVGISFRVILIGFECPLRL